MFKISLLLFVQFCMFSIIIYSNQIVDFSHSQLTAFNQRQTSNSKISIFPDKSIFQNYDFPQACQINTLLNQLQKNEQNKLQILNMDQYMKELKKKFLLLLQASQKIKNLQKTIKSLPQQRQQKALNISQEELKILSQKQEDLIENQDKIFNKTSKLKQLVINAMNQNQNPLFKETGLKFQKKSLEQKLKILNKILNKINNGQQNQLQVENQKYIENYFSQLSKIFDQENVILDDILKLFQNHNQVLVKRAKISNLKAQIQSYNLAIEQKQQCKAEIKQIREKQKNHIQIKELIKDLKKRKQQFKFSQKFENNQTNKYCEGVVNKSITRIRILLKDYDIIFICSSGIDQIKERKNNLQNQLVQVQKQLKKLQNIPGIQQFKKKYNEIKQKVNIKINQTNLFKIKQFSHSSQKIQQLIDQTKSKLEDINKKLGQLQNPVVKADRTQYLYQIQSLIIQLKKLKSRHCSLQSQYQQKATNIYQKLYGLEQQTQYNLNIEKIYIQKMNELRQTEVKMRQIQEEIIKMLKQ